MSNAPNSPTSPKEATTTASTRDALPNARRIATELANVIQETEDPVRLEELLGINDQLLSLLKKFPMIVNRPHLTLQGLGLNVDNSAHSSDSDGDGRLDGLPHINGQVNGHLSLEPSDTSSTASLDEEEADAPATPRVDKGKQKAEPEPEEPEMVLSPKTFIINERTEDGEYDDQHYHPEDVTSPTDMWVEIHEILKA